MLSAYLVFYAAEKGGRTDDGVEKKEDNAQSRPAPASAAARRARRG